METENKTEIIELTITSDEISNLLQFLNIIPVTTYEQTMAKTTIYQIIKGITNRKQDLL